MVCNVYMVCLKYVYIDSVFHFFAHGPFEAISCRLARDGVDNGGAIVAVQVGHTHHESEQYLHTSIHMN